MMYPRLKLARNLLTDDGVIFVSIDENEVGHLRQMLDEVFGESSFVAQLAVLNNPRGRAQDKHFATNHEYALVYSKRELPVGALSIAKPREQLESEYPYKDERGMYRTLGLRNSHREFGRFNRPNQYYPLYVDPAGKVYTEGAADRTEVFPLWNDGFEGCWTWGRPKATAESESLVGREAGCRIQIFVKEYAEGARRKLKSLLAEKEHTTDSGQRAFNDLFGGTGKIFQAPKSPFLLADFIEAGSGAGDIILDFFAGSGSTAHGAWLAQLRDRGARQWIAVQLPEPTPNGSVARDAGFDTVAEIARARLRRAGEAVSADLASEQSLDAGFRAFALTDTNFSKWNVSSDVDRNQLEQHLFDLRESSSADEASTDDLLTEILLKQGYSLTERIAPVDVAGLGLHSVGDGIVLAYLDERVKPTLEQLQAVVDAEPVRLIVLEDAFQGDDQLKTNLAQLCKSKSIELWTA